jgi:hypothetical protein
MRPAEADEGVCGITKAEKNATDFEIEVCLRAAGIIRLTQVENCAEENEQERGNGGDGRSGRPLPENPDDFGPISHELPQQRTKTGQTLRNARLCPFWAKNIGL